MNDDELLRAAAEVLLRRATQRPAPSPTVAALYALYATDHAAGKSWKVIDDRLAPVVAALGPRDAIELAPRDWMEYAQKRLQTPIPRKQDAGRCYSPKTVNMELIVLKMVLNWSVTAGHLKYNPIAGVRKMKARRGRETAPKEWEIGNVLAACETPQQRVMVLCAADAGLRRAEIIQLRHDWVDHERKTITLAGWACKNGRGGVVPATQRLLDAIDAIPRHIRAPQVLVSPRTAGPYHLNRLDEWWREIRERAGLEAAPGDGEAHLHDLRAACATNALARGVRLQIVSKKILRHSSLSTTEIYLRGHDDDLADTVEKFEAGIERDQRRAKRTEPAAGSYAASKSKHE